jgi:transposase
VAVPPDRDDEPVREFPSFTADLNALADWLAGLWVDTVAMESTGVYWIPLFELAGVARLHGAAGQRAPRQERLGPQVRRAGLPVAAATHDLWPAQRCVSPTDAVCVLRSLWRQRAMLLRSQGRRTAHAKGAHADEHSAGQRHLRRGGRDRPEDPARHRGRRARRPGAGGDEERAHPASNDEIAKSLQGNWRAEHLFALKQALAAFDFIGTQLAECDPRSSAQLKRLQVHDGEPSQRQARGRARNAPKFDLRAQLFKMCGVDLTRIDGIDVTTALAVISETGPTCRAFPRSGTFASWLGLCPGTKITGGKVMSGKTKRVRQPRAQACAGRRRAAHQPVGSGRVLQTHVRAHGQAQGRHRRGPQARAPDLHHADQGRGVHRPGPGLLRGALPPTCSVQLTQRAKKMGMKLVGTHTICFAKHGPFEEGELTLAQSVMDHADKSMIVTADRGFCGYEFWQRGLRTGAKLLFRVKSVQSLRRMQTLPDGSYLSEIHSNKNLKQKGQTTVVRVIEYALDGIPDAESSYRLITNWMGEDAPSAVELAALYHRRWTIEESFDELKTHLADRKVILRSKRPDLVKE